MNEVLERPTATTVSVTPPQETVPEGGQVALVKDFGTEISTEVRKLVSGFNYRRRFNAAAMAELVADIKANGLLQGLILRILENGTYQILAGHRRAIAFERVYGPLGLIYGKAKVYTDVEAIAVMVSENKCRDDPSAIEDAEAATRMLGELNGDKDETAKRLRWSRPLLDRRLAIMNAIEGVRDAFIDEKLLLGHVEILAAMPREAQDKVLVKLLECAVTPTVPQLKKMAEQVLLALEIAIFDKTDCNGCKFNTGHQQAMFETSFEGTRCTNSGCYNDKTEAVLQSRRVKLAETYQVVRIVRPGDNLTVNPLRAEGKKGVGLEQAKACRTCADFGACVSAVPDHLGNEFKDVCFNTTCLSEKVKIHEDSIKAAATADQQRIANAAADAISNAKGTSGKSDSGANKPGSGTKPASPKAQASSEPRNAIKEYREKIWRGVFHRGALKLTTERSRALLMALCLYRPSTLDTSGATKAIERETVMNFGSKHNAMELATQILTMDMKQLGAGLFQLPAYVSDTLEINAIVGFLKAFEIKIESHWKVNAGFFELLTKTEIDAVCIEMGIAKALGNDYTKLKNGSKADLVKAVMEIKGFEYVGKIPALMRW